MDALTRGKVKDAAQVADQDILLEAALQMHFDARHRRVPKRNVLERFRIKLAAEFAVDSHEHVLIEFCRHTLGIVVSRVKNVGVFNQVYAEQQSVARAERTPHSLEKLHSLI